MGSKKVFSIRSWHYQTNKANSWAAHKKGRENAHAGQEFSQNLEQELEQGGDLELHGPTLSYKRIYMGRIHRVRWWMSYCWRIYRRGIYKVPKQHRKTLWHRLWHLEEMWKSSSLFLWTFKWKSHGCRYAGQWTHFVYTVYKFVELV